jgi:hypothetical protein
MAVEQDHQRERTAAAWPNQKGFRFAAGARVKKARCLASGEPAEFGDRHRLDGGAGSGKECNDPGEQFPTVHGDCL